ncbi:HEsitatioN behavior [Caenorhabditis elegans]|uniref:HEN-1 n=1 Tax=Caenorhabditis elegans TaxID=6239 RepID=G5ECA8_CAEEL|nr:HEsitatioN behavior [Caenorhabditis elegans]BAC00782.1 HEN-1 [Caenorhabditis elegans]CCD66846.1 HEsitatioN behavior [Caenorhabditis elegans]|eukprot:NP_509200.1 HEsitatioN behavior [Caenorhabditis elegans]
MNSKVIFFVCALCSSVLSSQDGAFGHGNHRPLNDADALTAIKPVCETDRHGNKYIPCPIHDINDPRNWPCIKLADLCNGKADCPNGDDENYFQCFYHRARSEEYRRLMKMLEEIKGK